MCPLPAHPTQLNFPRLRLLFNRQAANISRKERKKFSFLPIFGLPFCLFPSSPKRTRLSAAFISIPSAPPSYTSPPLSHSPHFPSRCMAPRFVARAFFCSWFRRLTSVCLIFGAPSPCPLYFCDFSLCLPKLNGLSRRSVGPKLSFLTCTDWAQCAVTLRSFSFCAL